MGNEEAIEILYRELGTETENRLFPEVIEARDTAIKALQEQKVGKWLDDGVHHICSNCGCRGWNGDKFCPNCGAKMEGADNE